MEQRLEGPEAAPRIVEVMYFQGLPKQPTQQPNMALPQQWEAQWQEFLRTLQPALIGQGNPQLTDTVPWDDAKTFLSAFEQVAEACRWPQEEWVGRLVPALRGGVEQYICQLDPRDRRNYQKVKAAILRSDVVRMELKRQHFRQCRYQELEGPRRAYDQLQQLVRQWLKPEKHTKDQILELIIQEQLLATLPPDLQSWVQECGPEDCIEMVALAEDFLMGHRSITRTWDRQVPATEKNASSMEALPRQQCGGVTSSEMTPTRSSSVSLSFEEPQTSEAGLTRDSILLKKDADLDKKPTTWELMRASSRSSSCTSVLPTPSPETTSQPGPQHEESTPRTFADGRFLRDIKTETTDDSEDDNSYEPLPNEFPAATSSNRLTGQINPGSKLSLREGLETSVEHNDEHVRKKNKYDPLSHMHVCFDCGFQAYYISELQRHMKKHSNVDYNCPECGETIKGLLEFENHQKRHEGLDEPSTTTITHTGRETRTSENRPYRCPECDQTFTWQSSLSRHLRLHKYRRILPAKSKDLHEPQRNNQESTGDFREVISLHPAVDNSDPASRLRPRKPQEPDVQPLRQGIKTLRVVLTKLANTRTGKTHRCPECGYKTKWLSVLVKHMGIHTKEKPYTCHGCGKTFAWVSGLNKHQKYVCCQKLQATGDSPAQHLERHGSDEESRRMKNLPQEKSVPEGTSKAVTEGTAALPVKKTYPCSKCEYRAEKLSDLIKHIRIHIGEKPYKCHICEKAFTSPSTFAKHWQTHSDPSSTQPAPIPSNSSSNKGPAVAECDVTLSDEEEMINVLAQKSKLGGNKSAGKSTGAVSLGGKKQQQKRKTTETLKNTVEPKKSRYAKLERKHKCSYCDYRAYYLSDLLRHQVRHTKEKPYKCPECGQGFLKKSTLSSHRCKSSSQNQPGGNRNHSKEKRKYTCSRCGHKTYKLSTLLVHLRSHTEDKPYKCQECGAGFTQSSNLSRHKNIHRTAGVSDFPPKSALEPQENSAVPTGNEISSLVKVKEEEMEMEVTPPVTQGDSSMITSINQWRYNKEENDRAPAEECNKPIEPIKQEPAEALITPKEEKEMEGYGDPVEPPKEVTQKEMAVAEECNKSVDAPRDDLVRKGVSVRAMLERFAYCKIKEPDRSKAESETNPTDQEEAKK